MTDKYGNRHDHTHQAPAKWRISHPPKPLPSGGCAIAGIKKSSLTMPCWLPVQPIGPAASLVPFFHLMREAVPEMSVSGRPHESDSRVETAWDETAPNLVSASSFHSVFLDCCDPFRSLDHVFSWPSRSLLCILTFCTNSVLQKEPKKSISIMMMAFSFNSILRTIQGLHALVVLGLSGAGE